MKKLKQIGLGVNLTLSNKVWRKALGIIGIATILIPNVSYAGTIKDAAGALYIDDLTPNSRSIVEFPSAQKTINSNADACGRITIRNSASTPLTGVDEIKLDGTSVNTASLPTDTLPRCLNGVAEVNQTANFKTPDGSFVIVGQSPLSQHAIAFPGVALSRQVNANTCGFIRLTTSAQYPLTGTIKVNGDSVDTTTVTTGNPPRCINNVLYKPQS